MPRVRTTSVPSVPPRPLVAAAWLDPRAPFLLPLLALLATRAWLASRIPFASEDAYITFRYAWNLAHGAGAVFNPGEHVYGFTSAPWMVWLALGVRLGLDPLLWARVTSVAADAVTVLALGSLLVRHASRASAWCFALAWALWPYCSALAVTGLEMSAFVAMIALAGWLIDRQHVLTGVALGTLALFRPEGVLAAGVLAIWASRRDRWLALGIAGAGLGLLALYYGSPVPQSVRAKAIVYGAPGPLHARAWWEWVLPMPPLREILATREGQDLVLFSLVAAPAAVVGGISLWRQRTSRLTAVAAAGIAVWLSYVVVGASYFYWYMATPVFAWLVLVAVGLPHTAGNRWGYGACVAALLATWLLFPTLYINRTLSEQGLFAGAGDYIAHNAGAGESVLLEPLGTIGWRARSQRLIDEVGLVTPSVSARRAAGAGWYTDVLSSARPDWLVVRAGLLNRGTAFAGAGAPFRSEAEMHAALAMYQVVAMGYSVAGDQNLVILRRAIVH